MAEKLRTFGILNEERIVCSMKCEEFIEEVRGEVIKWIKELSRYGDICYISGYDHICFCLDCRKWFRRDDVIHLDHENLKYIGSRDPQCVIDEFKPAIDTLKIMLSITEEDLK